MTKKGASGTHPPGLRGCLGAPSFAAGEGWGTDKTPDSSPDPSAPYVSAPQVERTRTSRPPPEGSWNRTQRAGVDGFIYPFALPVNQANAPDCLPRKRLPTAHDDNRPGGEHQQRRDNQAHRGNRWDAVHRLNSPYKVIGWNCAQA